MDSKFHGERGHKLQEKIEELDTNRLGDSANVIVLRDSKFNFYNHLPRMDDELAQHVDIESLLAKEKKVVGSDEVNQSIDGLRDMQLPETWEDFNSVVRVLAEGFTSNQLSNYLKFALSRAEEQRLAEEPQPRTEKTTFPSRHITNVSAWMPGVSDVSHVFDEDPVRGYCMPSHTHKQRKALDILRRCWHWELPDITEGLGQFEVQMSKSDLDILSSMHQTYPSNLYVANDCQQRDQILA